jgi:hypothetical protein
MDKLRIIAQDAISLYEGAYFWLEGSLRFEPRLVMSKARSGAKMRYSEEAAMPGKSAGRVPPFRVIFWYLPYN